MEMWYLTKYSNKFWKLLKSVEGNGSAPTLSSTVNKLIDSENSQCLVETGIFQPHTAIYLCWCEWQAEFHGPSQIFDVRWTQLPFPEKTAWTAQLVVFAARYWSSQFWRIKNHETRHHITNHNKVLQVLRAVTVKNSLQNLPASNPYGRMATCLHRKPMGSLKLWYRWPNKNFPTLASNLSSPRFS